MDERDRHAAFADRGHDAFDRAQSYVAACEYAASACGTMGIIAVGLNVERRVRPRLRLY
jgi:hypothetical protein